MVVLAVAGAVAIAPVISGCGAGAEPQSAAPTQLTDGVNVSVPKDHAKPTQIALRNMFLLASKPGQPIAVGSSLPLYGVMINQVKGRQDRLVAVSSPLFGSVSVDGNGLVLPPAAPDGTGSAVKLLGKPSAPIATAPATPPRGQKPTGTPSQAPAGTPSQAPSGTPSQEASGTPSQEPTGTPSQEPSGTPSQEPTGAPATGPQATAPNGDQPLVVLTGLQQELHASARVPVRMQFEKAGTVDFLVPLVAQQGEYTSYPLPNPVGPAQQSPNPAGGTQPSTGATPSQPGTPQGSGAPEQPESPGTPNGTEPSGGAGN
ncbi:hypothetical protein GCM10022254_39830 [Actinomadura meridiana]|uniref:Lipoprotein n=2 Tax=Actinomadura meridiana TaxID=559626 RepID=A0ABP8C6M0_9ACTN